jgi:LAGLIDADG endonuclease
LDDLNNKIIPYFEKFSLLSKKVADFILFKQIVELMTNKAHLTGEGLQEIINIRASMNLGLSNIQITHLPNTIPVQRPIINTTNIPDPN